MNDPTTILTEVAWPVAILIAWLVGEYAYQRIKIPRISIYAAVGFTLGSAQVGLLPSTQSATTMLALAHIAFGLFLFECGYHINLRWLRSNPWLTVTSLSEAILTFTFVFFLLTWLELPSTPALLFAALSMATSPATILRTINEQRSAGQVTERVLHLTAFNSVLTVFVFMVIIGLTTPYTLDNFWQSTYSSFTIILASALLGVAFGFIIPILLRFTHSRGQDSTLAFTLAIITLMILVQSMKLSPVLAALVFGLSTRHNHIVLSPSQRGFGAIGDLFSVLLFVFVAASLNWQLVLSGIGLGLTIVVARQIAKVVGISLFSHISGISWRKGVLVGLASTPISAFLILALEQTRYQGLNFSEQLTPLIAATFILELLAPVLTQQALIWAKEVPETKET